jgi:sterol-4alpha-carboxylate 3-dehydrogenase (decarboxylating)
MANYHKVLVLGGNGFLGRHLVEDLIDKKKQVFVFDIRKHPDYDTDEKLKTNVIKFFEGDLTKEQEMLNALTESQVDTIFHCATPSPFGSAELLHKVNIEGSKVLLGCMKKAPNVKRILLVSSASVVYSGEDISDADENTPYARTGFNAYTDSKIAQEKLFLAANDKPEYNNVKIAAIRPAGIFGERDVLMFPNILSTGRAGRTKFYIGSGKNLFDFTYVKNVSHALMLAADKIEGVAGEPFFVTNMEPIPFWQFFGDVWEDMECPRPKIGIPAALMTVISYLIVFVTFLIRLFSLGTVKVYCPDAISPEKIAYLTTTRTFSAQKAATKLGYKPLYNNETARKKTIKWFLEQEKQQQQKQTNDSKKKN